jgi:hypothetical protein
MAFWNSPRECAVAIALGVLVLFGCRPVESAGAHSARPASADAEQSLGDVTVDAGLLNRDHSIVSFACDATPDQVFALRDAQGKELPVQVGGHGVATFVLPSLAAGEKATFALVRPTRSPSGGATAAKIGDAVRLSIGATTVLDFKTVAQAPSGVEAFYARAGYLHPIYTPGGVLVTGDYPVDHGHHHGVWTAWTRTRFNGHEVDFWNVKSGQGRVDLDRVNGTWQGPVHAGVDANLVHVDLVGGTKTIALNEHWVVRVYATHATPAPYFVFDLESTQTTATDSPLELLEYHYGGLALRGHAEWMTVSNAVFLASDGLDRTTGDNHAGRWCFIGGNVGGVPVGYAALGHPSNFRAPQKMRIHPKDPYMAFSPVKDGPFTIQPGTPYVTRFRFIAKDGPPDAALFERLWNDYATPPLATYTPRRGMAHVVSTETKAPR